MKKVKQKTYTINFYDYTAIEYKMKLPTQEKIYEYVNASLTVIYRTMYYDDFDVVASYQGEINDDVIEELISKKGR